MRYDPSSLAWPDPFRAAAYRLEIISAAKGLATRDYDLSAHASVIMMRYSNSNIWGEEGDNRHHCATYIFPRPLSHSRGREGVMDLHVLL